jgi:NifU-like protein involved in Fe-S cluster formation
MPPDECPEVVSQLLKNRPWPEGAGFFDEFRALSESRAYEKSSLEGGVEMSNPVCGDRVRVKILLEHGKVIDFGYQQKGCWPVAGCLELMGRLCRDARSEDIMAFALEDFLGVVRGVPNSKRHAFSLVHRATLAAVAQATVLANS